MSDNSYKNEFDIILILGSNEELFKKYVEKIHPDIIQNEFLRSILKHQIDDFNTNQRYLNWEKAFDKAFPGKANEEPHKEIFMELGEKHLEDISTQSPELLENRLKHLLERAETNRAIDEYDETGDLKELRKNLDSAASIGEKMDAELVERDLSEVPEKIEFLIEGRIVKGGITFIGGKGGTGKGVFSMGAFGAPVTTGSKFEGNQLKQGFVFLFNEEDFPRTVLNRLENNGGSVENLKWEKLKEDKDGYSPIFSIKHHLPLLRKKLKKIPKEKLTNSMLVIDGIGTFMGMKRGSDAYNDVDVRNVLTPLSKIAEEFNIAVVIIGHFNKTRTTELIHAILGSKAFVDISRAVYAIIEDEEDRERHYFLPLKWNTPELYNTGIEFRIEEDTDRIIIEKDVSAEEVQDLKAERQPGQRRTLGAGEAATLFLERELRMGQQKPKDLEKRVIAGLICGRDTLYAAARRMKKKKLIESISDGWGNIFWIWTGDAIPDARELPVEDIKEKSSEDVKEKVKKIKAEHQQKK